MDSLTVLSLGRNLLKKVEGVEAVADTLQELWLSYNQIEKLVGAWVRARRARGCVAGGLTSTRGPHGHPPPPPPQSGLEKLSRLRVLFLSNNRVRDWAEVERLASLPGLEDLLLVGNPLYNEHKDAAEYRIEVRRTGGFGRQPAGLWQRRPGAGTGQTQCPDDACACCPDAHAPPRADVPAQVLKRLPNLKKLDGIPVDVDERDQALQARGGGG